jgi:hypothetical protein
VSAGVGVITGNPAFGGSSTTGLDECSNMLNLNGGAACADPSGTQFPYGPTSYKFDGLGSVNGALYAFINGVGLTSTDGRSWTKTGLSWDNTEAQPIGFIDTASRGNSGRLPFGTDPTDPDDARQWAYMWGSNPSWGPSDFTSPSSPLNMLIRAPMAALADKTQYQYMQGIDASNVPVFSSDGNTALKLRHVEMTLNRALHRYVAVGSVAPLDGNDNPTQGMSQLTVWEAPQPWGPWSLVQTNTNWMNSAAASTHSILLHTYLVPKWTSADGSEMWLIFSSYDGNRGDPFSDRFNLIHAKLIVSSDSSPSAP